MVKSPTVRFVSMSTVTSVVMLIVSKCAVEAGPEGMVPFCQFAAVPQLPESFEIQNPVCPGGGGPPSGAVIHSRVETRGKSTDENIVEAEESALRALTTGAPC